MPADIRTASFGQNHRLTVLDRAGAWLSAASIRRCVGSFDGLTVADLGCGYNATFVRSVLPAVARAYLLDVALAPDLKSHAKVTAYEGPLEETAGRLEPSSIDVVMCMSVLEHLWQPRDLLKICHDITRPGGVCLLNVPSWLGKRALETTAFKLGLSTPAEIDDHKTYFDPKDLWPLLVEAGFRPRNIRCYKHKFGLNTFAVCRA